MNATSIQTAESLCSDSQVEAQRIYIIISISLLSIIGLASIIGNTLVLLVYCQSPRVCCGCCLPFHLQTTPRYRRGLQHSQRKLLIALAIVDLLTALFVLPFDVAIKFIHLFNLNDACMFSESSNPIYTIIDNARNIMFAIEGSILTSIAIDRFMVIGCPYVKTMGCKMWSCVNSSTDILSDQASYTGSQSKPSPTCDTIEISIPQSPTFNEDFELSTRKNDLLSGYVVTSDSTSNAGRRLCVLFPITITTLAITSFEITVFCLHFKKSHSADSEQDAVRLRYILNRIYLISTLVTFPLVCGPYVCIFLAIRSYEKKWARLHKGRSNHPKRSIRTAMTLFIATVVFYLTLLPVLIVHFVNWTTGTGSSDDMKKDAHMHPATVYIHHEFYYINNAVNFFIYSLVSPAFRKRLGELCKMC